MTDDQGKQLKVGDIVEWAPPNADRDKRILGNGRPLYARVAAHDADGYPMFEPFDPADLHDPTRWPSSWTPLPRRLWVRFFTLTPL